MLVRTLGFAALLSLVAPASHGSEIYKYQDEKGRWVFSDKKPAQGAETVVYKKPKQAPKPRLYTRKTDNGYELVAHNPYYAPIEYTVESAAFDKPRHKVVVPANTRTTLAVTDNKVPSQYRWRIGDPAARADGLAYHLPVQLGQSYRITQAFNGRFSHSKEPSLYAVDIAMPVGSYIAAAREGTVIWVKDDYHMGGNNSYFLDKANYVKVLHSDGTYAVYAHILEGSAMVKAGDTVATGDLIARAGSSGYSTGPHLHFVVRRNAGTASASVPFRFADSAGHAFTPRAGMVIAGTGTISQQGAGQ